MSKPLPADLVQAAKKARDHAYAPYSDCLVGAALRTRDGKIYVGCNVENSSYGGAICAERTAVVSAVAAQGKMEIAEMVVVTDASPPWPPCGICRQIIAEFGAQATIHLTNLQGESRTLAFNELLPDAFTPAHLKA